jgi:Skp family chaperone for outer membrane proteins
MKYFVFPLFLAALLLVSCKDSGSGSVASSANEGLRIAFVNGDSILQHFSAFRKESEAMDAKQRALEQELQKKGAALEGEIMSYQKQAQTGTLTGKEMQAREKYLGTKQEALLKERDMMAQEIMKETEEINKRLQAVIQEKLNGIRTKEGYDYILSYIEGGPVLVADPKHDITERVLKLLNEEEETNPTTPDTTKQQ